MVPPAKGKTRIAMAIALGLVKRKKFKKVVLVYQTQLLYQQDSSHWKKIKEFIEAADAKIIPVVGYQSGLLNVDNETVMIVDEADINFIEQAEQPP